MSDSDELCAASFCAGKMIGWNEDVAMLHLEFEQPNKLLIEDCCDLIRAFRSYGNAKFIVFVTSR